MTPARRAEPLGVHPEAAGAWAALRVQLDAIREAGHTLPCESNPEHWVGEATAEREAAAEGCHWCSIRTACAAFGVANREPIGVWGGIDRTRLTPSRGAP